jgi:hypothetical protein
VHPNTVRYRLEQAGALLGRDLTDPDSQFELQLLARFLGQRAQVPAPRAADSRTASDRATPAASPSP